MADDGDGSAERTNRALRLDLIIAICALLISSLASGASWWQARLLSQQTTVLQEQLGAQVWPYVSLNVTISKDGVQFALVNDGLGPAIMRSEAVVVDGSMKSSVVDALHAVLGPHLRQRGARLGIDGLSPGSVLRPGASFSVLTFVGKELSRKLLLASSRLSLRLCYCAIIPGQCWSVDSSSTRDPQAVAECPEIRNDLLHASSADELPSEY